MKKFRITVIAVLACAIILGGGLALAQASGAAPSETDPFGTTVYLGDFDKTSPFFETVLPEIAKNIKENNTHTISPYFDEMPEANNPNNFQGLGTATYANINGKTVTAEAFYRLKNESLCDPNVGCGLMIYQAIQYKIAHPDADVEIYFSTYRMSSSASVCVLPESKYYGYMRSLYTTNYDEHGFVRIAFMLTEAARMGIDVTIVGQLNSYAVKQWNPTTQALAKRQHLSTSTYFKNALKSECYDKYESGKKVSDFMTFTMVDWALGDSGSDMMHVKACAVSNYIASDGKEHGPAVWFSSSNLDDNSYIGANGNNGSQSGVAVSDHDALFNVTKNFIQLMADYDGQEDLQDLRDIAMERSKEQVELMLSGRADEIPVEEQIVYIGGEEDPIFELYFTPVGGGIDVWNTESNPYCKYVDKLPLSTDYVEFVFTNARFDSSFYVAQTIQNMVDDAFCNNKNVNNKVMLKLSDYNKDNLKKLTVGKDIGYKRLDSQSGIHSKDIMLSYAEGGERHYVSLMSSCNFHSGALWYQTNQILVIHETDETGNAFYKIFGDKYSYGAITND